MAAGWLPGAMRTSAMSTGARPDTEMSQYSGYAALPARSRDGDGDGLRLVGFDGVHLFQAVSHHTGKLRQMAARICFGSESNRFDVIQCNQCHSIRSFPDSAQTRPPCCL